MFNVLIALDTSSNVDEALSLATTLLAGQDVQITLLHVMPHHLINGMGTAVVDDDDITQEAQAASTALLDAAARRLHREGVGPVVNTELEVGDPADAILSAAQTYDTDLIILGSRGADSAQRFVFGSVSSKVAMRAPCAVLVAPSHKATARATMTAKGGYDKVSA